MTGLQLLRNDRYKDKQILPLGKCVLHCFHGRMSNKRSQDNAI